MFLRFLKAGLWNGLIYSASFLILEDVISIIFTRGDFSFEQILFSFIIYAVGFGIIGLVSGFFLFFFTSKGVRSSLLLSGRIFLMLSFFAIFYLGYGIIPDSFLPHSFKMKLIVLLLWGVPLLIIFLVLNKLLGLGKGVKPSVSNLRGIVWAAAITIFTIISLKIKFDPHVSLHFSEIGLNPYFIAFSCSLMLFSFILFLAKRISHVLPSEYKSKAWLWFIVFLLSGTAFLYSTLHAESAIKEILLKGGNPKTPDNPPNVIFIVVDALRADFVGLYNYEKKLTPSIDYRSYMGALFEDALAVSSWTKPSAASYFTGLYPGMLGVDSFLSLFPEQLVTLQEVLRENGYYTKAISTNHNVSADYNYDQGFDDFTYIQGHGFKQLLFPHPLLAEKLPILMEWCFRLRLLDGNVLYGDALTVNEEIIPWLKAHHNEQFFLYLHYMEPHYPYYPRRAYYSKRQALTLADLRIMRERRGLEAAGSKKMIKPTPEIQHLIDVWRNRYQDEIIEADFRLGQLFALMDELNIWENSLVILTSDHGEEFNDHGMAEHGNSMYNEVLHVPLMIFFPDGEHKGARIPHRVHLTDLAPTIYNYLKINPGVKMDGVSLLPLLSGDVEAYQQARGDYFGEVKPIRQELHWEKVYAAISDNRKLIKTIFKQGGFQLELFNRDSDVGDLVDISGEFPQLTQALAENLEEYINRCDSLGIEPIEYDPESMSKEQLDKLRGLGYIK